MTAGVIRYCCGGECSTDTGTQLKSVAAGENIEIRVEVKDISGNVPREG